MQSNRYLLTLLILISLFLKAFSQPVDNPYRTFYQTDLQNESHWTDTINWQNTINIKNQAGVIDQNKNVDSVQFAQLIQNFSTSGGGVIYFPADTYYFNNSFFIRNNIILRGATPAITNAKDSSFAPLTHFIFPKYIPTFTGSGTSNRTAFKTITALPYTNNAGLVYININRARIAIVPRFFTSFISDKGVSYANAENNRNVLIFGIRSNNTAAAEPAVPSSIQNAWQRYSSRHAYSITLFVFANGIISNCRINDLTANKISPIEDDSYDQPNYLFDNRSGGVSIHTDGSKARFNYLDHYAIRLNRNSSSWDNSRPEDSPDLFRNGIEVSDNWVYKTMRVAIIASGNGLKIKNNILKDKEGKYIYLDPIGNRKVNYANTYENRGIDWSGWNVSVVGNLVEVYKHNFEGVNYQSVDGEGILIQDCCGGTLVNGAIITDNELKGTHPYLALYKVQDIYNVAIKRNKMNNGLIEVLANTNSGDFSVHNLDIDGNTNLTANKNESGRGIKVAASNGGTNSVIRNNVFNGTGGYFNKIEAPCHVKLEANNIFKNSIIPIDSFKINNKPCPSIIYPEGKINNPKNDTTVVSGTNINIEISLKPNTVDSIVIYQNAMIVKSMIVNGDTVINYELSIPSIGKNTSIVCKLINNNGKSTFTNTRNFTFSIPLITYLSNVNINKNILISPNPFIESFNIFKDDNLKYDIEIYDLVGKIIYKNIILSNEKSKEILLKNIKTGIYMVKLFNNEKTINTYKILKTN